MSQIHMRLPHDAGFKNFVLHEVFLRHLLRAFPLSGVREEDVARIRPYKANFVGDLMEQRLPDAVWELETRDRRLIYVVVECQSSVDRGMHFRMMNVSSMLYIEHWSRPPGEGYSKRRVPKVKLLVVHSGEERWTAPRDVAEAVGDCDLEEELDIPRQRYAVLDLRRWEVAGGAGNFAVLLSRLLRCDDPDALHEASRRLGGLVASEGDDLLARRFASWISGYKIPELGILDARKSDNLELVLDMLKKERLNWAQRVALKAQRKGELKGERRGERRGELKGYRNALLRQARVRFGEAIVATLAALLEPVTNISELDEINDWVTTSESGEALLARLGRA